MLAAMPFLAKAPFAPHVHLATRRNDLEGSPMLGVPVRCETGHVGNWPTLLHRFATVSTKRGSLLGGDKVKQQVNEFVFQHA